MKVQLDLDNPKAAYAYKLLKEKRVRQMSFAYQVTDGASKEGCFEITGCKIFEVSIVPVGANQVTSIESVKALQDDEEDEPNGGEATEDTGEDEDDTSDTDLTADLEALEEQLAKIVDLVAEIIEKNQGEENPEDEPTDEEPGGTGSETGAPETDPRKGGNVSVKKEADKLIARANHLLNL